MTVPTADPGRSHHTEGPFIRCALVVRLRPRLVPSWVVPNLFYCLTTSLNSDPAYLAILLSNLLGVSYDLYLSTSVCDFTQTR